jgi:ABC-type transporter Mla subunit MlaD
MPLGDLFESSGVEMRIQDLIQTMEQFSAALMNPEQTLKELTPMADALGEEAESLFRQSPDSENPVQDFARRTALLARVEVEKFRRGDFL